jgi:YVTN family beta-propeller protein
VLVAALAVACGPSRGLRLERTTTASDRRAPTDALVEIDPKTGSVVHVVRIVDPGPVVVSRSSVWVASAPTRTVSRIDAHSGRLLTTTRLAAPPVALAPGPAGSVWVLTSGTASSVIQLDAETGQVTKRFALARCCPNPGAIASLPSGDVLVAGLGGVMRIDPTNGSKTIVAPHLRAVAIAAGSGNQAFVRRLDGGMSRLPAAFPPGIQLRFFGVGFVYGHGTLWLVDFFEGFVLPVPASVLETGAFETPPPTAVRVGRAPAEIAYGEGSVWVANRGDGTISQINPVRPRVTRTIHVGYRPAGLAAGAGAVWVTTRRISAMAGATGLLAFDDRGQIFTVWPDGTHRRQLTHARWPQQDSSPEWSPDGRRIVFIRGRHSDSGFTPLALSVMNADGTDQREIPHTSHPDGGAPAWSPDGTTIAFSSGNPASRFIYTIAPDGTNRTRIAHQPPNGRDPVWSPDGTQIAFDTNAHTFSGYIGSIYTIRLDGTHLRQITDTPSQYPAWSPEGRVIAFTRYMPDGASLGTFLAPAVGPPSGARLLSRANMHSDPWRLAVASWSPDGTAIVLSGQPGTSPPAVHIANADGSGLTYVTRGKDATWRPVP